MTDEQILAIAAQLWQQSGGAEFTMERLTAATEVSRATLYRRFGSREAILQRLASEQALDVEELLRPDIPTRIVEATRVALNRSGFAGITVEQIAQEAGVGPATVYRHFGSKEALLEAFVQASSPRQMLRSLVADEQSNLEADLILIAITMLEFVQSNPGLLRMILLESQSSEAIMEHIRFTQGRTVTALANYIAGHITLGNLPHADAFALALAFIGILLGLALVGAHSYDRPITDVNATARLAVQTFLHGITHPHPQQSERHS